MNHIIQQEDHKRYTTDIDELFSATSSALADLRAFMQLKPTSNPNRALFAMFYRGFCDLFNQTQKSKIMQDNESALINDVNKWLDEKVIDQHRVRRGGELFIKWGRQLEHHGIHTLTK